MQVTVSKEQQNSREEESFHYTRATKIYESFSMIKKRDASIALKLYEFCECSASFRFTSCSDICSIC